MGSVISKAANGIGGVLGNAFAAPFKSIFGDSCQDICSGPWDLICFIEHLCVTNLIKLFMIFGLAYITLMFFYLLFKVGIIQCIIRSLCKMCCAACETYWFALQDLTCFLWHKITNIKRVYRGRRGRGRRRFIDVEEGYSSGSTSDGLDSYHGLGRRNGRKRKSIFGERRKIRRHNSHSYHRQHHHHVKLRTKEISVHVKGGSQRLRNSRRLQLVKTRNMKAFKKRRVR